MMEDHLGVKRITEDHLGVKRVMEGHHGAKCEILIRKLDLHRVKRLTVIRIILEQKGTIGATPGILFMEC